MLCKKGRAVKRNSPINTNKYVQISVNIAKYTYKYPQIPLYLPPFSPLASKYIQNTGKYSPPSPLFIQIDKKRGLLPPSSVGINLLSKE